MYTNRLAQEKSPYLLQHANNPVDWHAWGPEAFDKARREDKPIFLSIGYSTCHWCHVMERESFENEEIASILNRDFVSIKVDREERPDVDRIYMTFVQATTGGGGWPMSVWLTPELQPFYGGTYFPPDSRWGRPGFGEILEQLARAWQGNRTRIIESGRDMVEQLTAHVKVEGVGRVDESTLESGFYQFRRNYDSRLGGWGGAPKFPRPATNNFLLRYAVHAKNEEAQEMVLLTLREMAKGGMNDQIGGGFHRYSVDARWFVPHFEKMLYDQAQLAISYLEAYQLSGDESFAGVARDIFEYVLRDMTHAEGGFFSAEDADSVIDSSKPHEKGEGAFYIWSQEEINAVLGEPAASQFSYRYGVQPDGNVAEDPHNEFTGRNILYQAHTIEETAAKFGIGEEELRQSLAASAQKLFAERNKRIRPHLDDKVLTGWNGLMISAFAKGARVLADGRYLEAAQRAARFVLDALYRDGVLLRRWRDGDAAVPGFLDDYAYFVQALLDLYEADFDSAHLQRAIELTRRMRELFEDVEYGGFFSTSAGDTSILMRIKEEYDGAEPSGNSIAVMNLLRLGRMTGRAEYTDAAEKSLRAFSSKVNAAPSGMPQMLAAIMLHFSPPRQIVLSGERGALAPMTEVIRRKFLPFHTVLWAGSSDVNAELERMRAVDGIPTAYVCENFSCQLPTSEAAELAGLLK